ncbi:MAG: hypothetical protein RhofKO_35940 [Rhodothermales bacterium]
MRVQPALTDALPKDEVSVVILRARHIIQAQRGHLRVDIEQRKEPFRSAAIDHAVHTDSVPVHLKRSRLIGAYTLVFAQRTTAQQQRNQRQ